MPPTNAIAAANISHSSGDELRGSPNWRSRRPFGGDSTAFSAGHSLAQLVSTSVSGSPAVQIAQIAQISGSPSVPFQRISDDLHQSHHLLPAPAAELDQLDRLEPHGFSQEVQQQEQEQEQRQQQLQQGQGQGHHDLNHLPHQHHRQVQQHSQAPQTTTTATTTTGATTATTATVATATHPQHHLGNHQNQNQHQQHQHQNHEDERSLEFRTGHHQVLYPSGSDHYAVAIDHQLGRVPTLTAQTQLHVFQQHLQQDIAQLGRDSSPHFQPHNLALPARPASPADSYQFNGPGQNVGGFPVHRHQQEQDNRGPPATTSCSTTNPSSHAHAPLPVTLLPLEPTSSSPYTNTSSQPQLPPGPSSGPVTTVAPMETQTITMEPQPASVPIKGMPFNNADAIPTPPPSHPHSHSHTYTHQSSQPLSHSHSHSPSHPQAQPQPQQPVQPQAQSHPYSHSHSHSQSQSHSPEITNNNNTAKRKRSEDDDEGKSAEEEPAKKPKPPRGRPRLTAVGESPNDRRRKQIRDAQRAYRHRKDQAITDLEQKVKRMEETNLKMTHAFSNFAEMLQNYGAPEISQHFREMSAQFLSDPGLTGRGDYEVNGGSPPGDRDSRLGTIQEAHHSASRRPTLRTVSSASSDHHTLPVTAQARPSIQNNSFASSATSIYPPEPTTYEVIAQPTPENASFPSYAPNPQEPGTWMELPATMPPSGYGQLPLSPKSRPDYTFGRHVHLTTLRKALLLSSMPSPPAERFSQVFGYSILYESREQIIDRLARQIEAVSQAPMNNWEAYFPHPNGYAKRVTEFPGWHGEVFIDSEDVDRYLAERNIRIPMPSDYVDVTINLDDFRGAETETIPINCGTQAAQMQPQPGYNQRGSWTAHGPGPTAAMGTTNHSMTTMFVDRAAPGGHDPASMNPFLCPAIPVDNWMSTNPPIFKARLDVKTLVTEIMHRSVCLGKTPGLRPKDIDRAVKLSTGWFKEA